MRDISSADRPRSKRHLLLCLWLNLRHRLLRKVCSRRWRRSLCPSKFDICRHGSFGRHVLCCRRRLRFVSLRLQSTLKVRARVMVIIKMMPYWLLESSGIWLLFLGVISVVLVALSWRCSVLGWTVLLWLKQVFIHRRNWGRREVIRRRRCRPCQWTILVVRHGIPVRGVTTIQLAAGSILAITSTRLLFNVGFFVLGGIRLRLRILVTVLSFLAVAITVARRTISTFGTLFFWGVRSVSGMATVSGAVCILFRIPFLLFLLLQWVLFVGWPKETSRNGVEGLVRDLVGTHCYCV